MACTACGVNTVGRFVVLVVAVEASPSFFTNVSNKDVTASAQPYGLRRRFFVVGAMMCNVIVELN
jgi:hypothetical protein